MARSRKIRKGDDDDGTTLEVDNPFDYAADDRGEGAKRIKVKRALRNDPLAKMHATGRLNDVEYSIGRDLQELFEAVEIGHVRGVDFTNEPVDGGGHVPQGITDRQLQAAKMLNKQVYPVLGQIGTTLVRAILAEGMLPEEFARKLGATDAREINSYGREFRRYLAALAPVFGYETGVSNTC